MATSQLVDLAAVSGDADRNILVCLGLSVCRPTATSAAEYSAAASPLVAKGAPRS